MKPPDLFYAELVCDSVFVSSCQNKCVVFNQKPDTCSSHFPSEVCKEESVILLFECSWAVMFDKPEMVSFVLVDYSAVEESCTSVGI